MPRVISINLLNFDLRKNTENFHQIIRPLAKLGAQLKIANTRDEVEP